MIERFAGKDRPNRALALRAFALFALAMIVAGFLAPARAGQPSPQLADRCRAYVRFFSAHAWEVDGGRMRDARVGEQLALQLAQGSELCAGVLHYKYSMLQSGADDRNVALDEYVIAATYARKQGAQQRACGYAGQAYRILAALRKIPGYLDRHHDKTFVDALGCHLGSTFEMGSGT